MLGWDNSFFFFFFALVYFPLNGNNNQDHNNPLGLSAYFYQVNHFCLKFIFIVINEGRTVLGILYSKYSLRILLGFPYFSDHQDFKT